MIIRKLMGACGALAVAAGLSTATTPAVAETELVLSSWLPAKHPIVAEALVPWAEEIGEVTEGRVTVRVLARPLGAPPAHFDMAVDGVADITYGLHSFTRDDRFLGSRIGQFSFIGDDAVSGSKAFWKVYTESLDARGEHEGVELLSLFVHGPGVLHNNVRRIEKPEDLQGLKIRTPGGYIADLMGDLGATTLFMSSGEVFEKLSRGVIDGVTFPFDALKAFKLNPHLGYSMRVPGGIYNTTWFVVMNEAKWDGISDADRAAITAISGDVLAARIGEAWNNSDAKSLEMAIADGLDVYDAPPAMVDAIKASAAQFESSWVEAVNARGSDGAAALEQIRSLTAGN